MSGFAYHQPLFDSSTYNPAFYLSLDQSGSLTYAYAQTLYLSRNDYRLSYITGITQGTATPGIALVPGLGGDISGIGALSCTSLTVNGSPVSTAPSYVVGISPGTAAINKALVLDGSGNIATINNLTATTISGTIATAAQQNITSLGTRSSLTVSGNINGTIATGAQPNITSLGTLTSLNCSGNISGTLATASQPNITSLGTLSSLTVSGNITGTIATASQPNITSVGTLSSLSVSSSISLGATSATLSLVGGASVLTISGVTASTTATTGCLVASGGVGIGKKYNSRRNRLFSIFLAYRGYPISFYHSNVYQYKHGC